MVDIALDEVTVEFPGEGPGEQVTALRDLTLHVRSGELLALVGPSGSGKSTVLRTVAGLDTPSHGVITIDGQIVNALPPRERDVALVSQYDTLLPHLTVEENLGFALRVRKLSRQETARRVDAEARALGLWSKLRRRPRHLSSGERQKAALGRATTRNPRVYLLDEPLAALDAGERDRVRRELRTLQRGLGVTAIYVTHDQRDAMALGDRVAVMDEGRVVQVDEPMRLYADPVNLFVARFFGAPPLGVLQGTLHDDGTTAWIDVSGAALRLHANQRLAVATHGVASQLALGLRATAVTLASPPTDDWSRQLPLQVRSVEPLGAMTFVLLQPPGTSHAATTLYATVPPGHPVARGDRIDAVIDLRGAFVFDGDTGVRIHPPLPARMNDTK